MSGSLSVKRMARQRRFATRLAATGGLIAAAWLAGFVWFVHGALQEGDAKIAADGIVVLTGGADRVASGLSLLENGRGKLLLISGVGHGVGLTELMRGTAARGDQLAARITLGHTATTTIGNAEETAVWAAAHRLRSLLVVTAGYHMQRALREIGRAAPDLALHPAPVIPPALRSGSRLSAFRLLAYEYDKWLASTLGFTRLGAIGAGPAGTELTRLESG